MLNLDLMRVIPAFNPETLRHRLTKIIGPTFIQKVCRRVENNLKIGFGTQILLERYYVEIILYVLFSEKNKNKELLLKIFTKEQMSQAILDSTEFLEIFLKIYELSGSDEKKLYAGRFRQCLDMDHGFTPLAAECHLAQSLFSNGYSVAVSDLGGGADFFVKKQEIEASLECKSVSEDVGNVLTARQAGEVAKHFIRFRPDKFMVICVDRSLYPPQQIQSHVRDQLIGRDGDTPFNIFEIDENKFREWEAVAQTLNCSLSDAITRRLYHDYGLYLENFFQWSRRGNWAVAICRRDPSNYEKNMIKELKEKAKKQLNSKSNNIIVVRMNELSVDDTHGMFTKPSKYSPLPHIAKELFDSQSAGHLTGISFISRPRHTEGGFLTKSGQGHAMNKYEIRWFANDAISGSHQVMKELFPGGL